MFVLFKVSANVRVLGMKLSNQMFVYKFSSVFVVGCMLSIGRANSEKLKKFGVNFRINSLDKTVVGKESQKVYLLQKIKCSEDNFFLPRKCFIKG